MFNADAELHVENDINCTAPVAAGDAVAGPVMEAAIQAMYVAKFPLFDCNINKYSSLCIVQDPHRDDR